MTQNVVLVDYGAGNVRSAERALIAAADLAGIDAIVTLTHDPERIRSADRIVLPGQGAFSQCVTALQAEPGLVDSLSEAVRGRGAPFLGICVGMQLLMRVGLEHGEHAGLGWIDGECRMLEGAKRLPHMGWNETHQTHAHPVLDGVASASHVYFAHSYIVAPSDPSHVAATAAYGETFAAAIAHANMVGVQFHPEKSQAIGLDLLSRFLRWTPS